MMNARCRYTTVEDFLYDDDFIRYVLDDDEYVGKANEEWSRFVMLYPHLRCVFLRAKDILLHLDEQKILSAEQKACLRRRISLSLQAVRRN